MARKNLKIPEDLFHALREDKDDQQSWPHYLEEQCLLNSKDGDTRAELVEDIREQLDRIEAAAETAEQRTGNIERQVEGMFQ